MNPRCHLLETVKIVNMQGVPSKELVSELDFDFPIETLGTNLTDENILFVHIEIIQQME